MLVNGTELPEANVSSVSTVRFFFDSRRSLGIQALVLPLRGIPAAFMYVCMYVLLCPCACGSVVGSWSLNGYRGHLTIGR